MRKADIKRKTRETDITLDLDLDGKGESKIDTGCGFLNHMLELFAKHGRFDMDLKCVGDMDVDAHHTVEDVAIVLGQGFDKALGTRQGITRYGDIILPMDEALVLAAVDISARAHLSCGLSIPSQKVGDFDTELAKEFFEGFSRASGICIHLKQFSGENSHHIIEAAFKAFARALKKAVSMESGFENDIPSTKGMIV